MWWDLNDYNYFVKHLLPSLRVKEFWLSVNILAELWARVGCTVFFNHRVYNELLHDTITSRTELSECYKFEPAMVCRTHRFFLSGDSYSLGLKLTRCTHQGMSRLSWLVSKRGGLGCLRLREYWYSPCARRIGWSLSTCVVRRISLQHQKLPMKYFVNFSTIIQYPIQLQYPHK